MADTPKIRVLLADDHVLFSDGLVLQLHAGESSVEVVGQVWRGNEVLPAVHRLSPDVVLLDINLPQLSGIDCARLLVRDFPSVRVLMLTMYDYQKFIDQCRSIGVAGYLLKSERVETIIQTVRQVYSGQTNGLPDHFPNAPASHGSDDDALVRRFNLTPTEVKIIGLVHKGLSSQQIAGRLFVSYETVKSHRKNIYRKLNIAHLSELINFANEYVVDR